MFYAVENSIKKISYVSEIIFLLVVNEISYVEWKSLNSIIIF